MMWLRPAALRAGPSSSNRIPRVGSSRRTPAGGAHRQHRWLQPDRRDVPEPCVVHQGPGPGDRARREGELLPALLLRQAFGPRATEAAPKAASQTCAVQVAPDEHQLAGSMFAVDPEAIVFDGQERAGSPSACVWRRSHGPDQGRRDGVARPPRATIWHAQSFHGTWMCYRRPRSSGGSGRACHRILVTPAGRPFACWGRPPA